jgi:hypothetical protein
MKANLPAESTSSEAKETTEAKEVAEALEAPVGKAEARVATPTKPKYHCTTCKDLEEEDYIWQGHDISTCNRPGGGMDGQSISKCRRIQREQYQSTWSQSSNAPNPWRQDSDKAQGKIPDDYERDSEGSEAQRE